MSDTQPALDLKPAVPQLAFDPVPHIYTVDGVEIPGITGVLKDVGIIDFSMVRPDVLAAAAQFGTDVHAAVQFYEDGDLDSETMIEEVHGCLMAYLKFKNEADFVPELVEHRVWSPTYRYATHIDLVGQMQQKHPAVINLKTGDTLPWHGVQLAAETALLADARKYRRFTLKLNPDGTYKVKEWAPADYRLQLEIFHAALAVWHWKRNPR